MVVNTGTMVSNYRNGWSVRPEYSRIPLDEVLRYPLVMADPEVCEGLARQVDRVLRGTDAEPLVIERVASYDQMRVLVAAGFALGLAGAAHIKTSHEPGVSPGRWRGRGNNDVDHLRDALCW